MIGQPYRNAKRLGHMRDRPQVHLFRDLGAAPVAAVREAPVGGDDQADRAGLQTQLVLHAIRRFQIATDEFHNDSTTVTFSGAYQDEEEQKPSSVGLDLQPAKITHGHNKDHRDDLKQLLWILTVSADDAVPVHCRIADGNTEDSQTHRQTWDTLRTLAGRSGRPGREAEGRGHRHADRVDLDLPDRPHRAAEPASARVPPTCA